MKDNLNVLRQMEDDLKFVCKFLDSKTVYKTEEFHGFTIGHHKNSEMRGYFVGVLLSYAFWFGSERIMYLFKPLLLKTQM